MTRERHERQRLYLSFLPNLTSNASRITSNPLESFSTITTDTRSIYLTNSYRQQQRNRGQFVISTIFSVTDNPTLQRNAVRKITTRTSQFESSPQLQYVLPRLPSPTRLRAGYALTNICVSASSPSSIVPQLRVSIIRFAIISSRSCRNRMPGPPPLPEAPTTGRDKTRRTVRARDVRNCAELSPNRFPRPVAVKNSDIDTPRPNFFCETSPFETSGAGSLLSALRDLVSGPKSANRVGRVMSPVTWCSSSTT